MIRNATEYDFHQIVVMSAEFWQHTMFDDTFCYDTVFSMVSTCCEQGLLCVAEINGEVVGFAAGIQGALLGNAAVKTGNEVAWWVSPEHRGGSTGIKLLKFIENLARAKGIKYWSMAFMCSSMPETVEQIYQKLGYEKSEVVYTRML